MYIVFRIPSRANSTIVNFHPVLSESELKKVKMLVLVHVIGETES